MVATSSTASPPMWGVDTDRLGSDRSEMLDSLRCFLMPDSVLCSPLGVLFALVAIGFEVAGANGS